MNDFEIILSTVHFSAHINIFIYNELLDQSVNFLFDWAICKTRRDVNYAFFFCLKLSRN